ncbi:uncharacterized protein LOC122529545 [Frieseomelitta varia]|uniref:uncharacterized protein LOC122529545 n=1 Tax=Frieseomelitta varia TaxID=561572 RepID=UPI001CB686EF|nr:uncharacterized protein LOC122529545 [Frieseomelitta varia]
MSETTGTEFSSERKSSKDERTSRTAIEIRREQSSASIVTLQVKVLTNDICPNHLSCTSRDEHPQKKLVISVVNSKRLEMATRGTTQFYAPLFWPEKPDLWFKQLDIHFDANDVRSDQAKFSFALAHMDASNAGEIADIISCPPEYDRYETLRTEMVRRLNAIRRNQLQGLFEQEEMGDRTPSQFLRHMRTLAGEAATDEFLKTKWLNRLPPAVRTIVSTLYVPLDQLAVAADRIQETIPTIVASNARHPEMDQLNRKLDDLRKQMAELVKTFARATARTRSRSRSKSRRRRSKSPAAKDHCWYHKTFGDRSTKCRSPCNFNLGNGEFRH